MDQTQNGGTWYYLTNVSLNTANNLTVTLSGQGNGTVIADAIRIVPNATTQTQNNTYFIYTDHLDTPREIRNYANQLRWTWYAEQAEAFGANVPNDNPAALGAFTYNLRFPGQIYDAATGLSYNDNRIYVARSGRYLTSDPIGLAGGINTYGYVGGNPLSYSDPLGLATCGHYPEGHPLRFICENSPGDEGKLECVRKCLRDSLPPGDNTPDLCKNPEWYYDDHPRCWLECKWLPNPW